MYSFVILSRKVEKRLQRIISERDDVEGKLRRLKENPREELDAHKLKGDLDGKWSCWLGGDIRLIYEIDDVTMVIAIVTVGSHKEYG